MKKVSFYLTIYPFYITESSHISEYYLFSTATSQFNYEPGTTYQFEYDTEIRTSLQGSAEDYSGVKMSAIVHMEFTSKCEMTMRVSIRSCIISYS